jgi:hypothetical protein
VSSLVADAATIWFDSPLKSTQPEGHIEACVIERRESALNGDEGWRMGRDFWPLLFKEVVALLPPATLFQDSVDEDDADMDMAGDVGEELSEQIVDGGREHTGDDTFDGG